MARHECLPCIQLKALLGHGWRSRGEKCPGTSRWVSLEGKNTKWQRETWGARSTQHAGKPAISLVRISIWDKPTLHMGGEMYRELQIPTCSAWDPAECSRHSLASSASEVTVPSVPGRGGLSKQGPNCLRQLPFPLISNSLTRQNTSWRALKLCADLRASVSCRSPQESCQRKRQWACPLTDSGA